MYIIIIVIKNSNNTFYDILRKDHFHQMQIY